MLPVKPCFTSRGMRPEWSMWAWVTTTASMYPAAKSSSWLSRSSTRIFFPPHSTQWQLPVTALAAPKKVSFMGHLLVQFLQGYCTPKTSRCK